MARLFLLDGMGLAYRAYYAFIGRPLSNARGENISALFGFANTVLKLRREERPDYWALAWDGPGPTFRHVDYPEYKATRRPTPEDLLAQIEPLHRLSLAIGLPLAEIPGTEADDVMATLARRAAREGMEVALVTSDKDLVQVVADGIRLLMPQGKGEEAAWVDAQGVRERWGVAPLQMRDVLALMGDSVDNIPGVAGVGEKTAVQLVQRFGSLEELYRRLDQVERPALRQKLTEHRDAAFFSRQLATVKDDLALPWTWEDLRVRPISRPALRQVAERYELKRLARVAEEEGVEVDPAAPPVAGVEASSQQRLALEWEVVAEPSPAVIVPPGSTASVCAALRAAGREGVALAALRHGEDPRTSRVLGLALAVRADQVYYLSLGHEEVPGLAADELRAALAPLITGVPVRGHDLKSVSHVLAGLGLELGRPASDVMLASYLCDPERSHALADLARDFAGMRMRPLAAASGRGKRAAPPSLAEAAAQAVDAIRAVLVLHPLLVAQIEGTGQSRVYHEVELPLLPVLFAMERVGVRLDPLVLREMSGALQGELARLERQARELAGEDFNPNSSQQVARVLFEKLGLKGGRRTKTGYSTDQSVLEELALRHPLPRLLLDYRLLSKLKSTYVDALPALLDPGDGRLHTSFNQAVAATGRLSSSNPNLQNIPLRTEQGRAVRRAFVAEPGWKLVGADYSQIELRVLAHLSGDPNLIGAFQSGEDVHARTARRAFRLGPGEVGEEMRARAKIINFGVIYGMGARTLAQQMGVAVAEASGFIEDYFRAHEGVKRYLEGSLRDARERGYTVTLLGRRRYLPALSGPGGLERPFAERAAVNTPIQGSAADLIKLAMVRVATALRAEGRSARLLLQVHDELLLECPDHEVDAVRELVRREMVGVWPLEVPLSVSLGAGENWLDVH